MPKFAYSLDEESYQGGFNSEMEAAAEAFESDPDLQEVHVGEEEIPKPETTRLEDVVLEHICCQDEYTGDWADNWPDANKEQREELNTALQTALQIWLDKHSLRPGFFICERPRKITREEYLEATKPS